MLMCHVSKSHDIAILLNTSVVTTTVSIDINNRAYENIQVAQGNQLNQMDTNNS